MTAPAAPSIGWGLSLGLLLALMVVLWLTLGGAL